jgi:UDPglucose 6-dehydrogenase
MKIAIIGAGYVGLVTAAWYSGLGHDVICIENNGERLSKLKNGQSPFFEPGLNDLLSAGITSGKLKFESSLNIASVGGRDLIMLCVGTPPKDNGQVDMSQVFGAAEQISKCLTTETVICTKSTVPVGTGLRIRQIISKNFTGIFHIASCPEFLREGSAIIDSQKPDRVIIGADSDQAKKILLDLYATASCAKLVTNIETAELIKYASNAFLATKISFINEIANVCEGIGADVDQVAEGMGYDKRIGPHFLRAGVGYGGSCFPKDVRALQFFSCQNGYQFQLLKSVIEVNNNQRWHFYQKIKKRLETFNGKYIGIWGAAFKPNTDDIRESVAMDLIEKMLDDGARVKVYDPQALQNLQKRFGDRVNYAFSKEFAAQDVDCLLLLTEWEEFQMADMRTIKDTMKEPILFDGRNVFNPHAMELLGFDYYSIGRH